MIDSCWNNGRVLSKRYLSIYIFKMPQTALWDLIWQVTRKKNQFLLLSSMPHIFKQYHFLYNKGIDSHVLVTVVVSNTTYSLYLYVLFWIKASVYNLILECHMTHDSNLCKWSLSQIAASCHFIYVSIINAMLYQAHLRLPLFLLSS